MEWSLTSLINDVLNEENVSGGTNSVYGANVTATANPTSSDSYATGDFRTPTVLGKVQRRKLPKGVVLPIKLKGNKKQ